MTFHSPFGLQLIPVEDVDGDQLCRHAWVTVNGVMANSDQDEGSFDVDASQYVSAAKDLDAANRPFFPVRANYDLTSSRYKKKPTLRNGKYITLTGYLTCINKDPDGTPTCFVVDLEHVVFLGQAPPPAAPAISATTTGDSLSTLFNPSTHTSDCRRRKTCSQTQVLFLRGVQTSQAHKDLWGGSHSCPICLASSLIFPPATNKFLLLRSKCH